LLLLLLAFPKILLSSSFKVRIRRRSFLFFSMIN
jgi:hypothetical protein